MIPKKVTSYKDLGADIGFVIICTLLLVIVPTVTYRAFNDFGIWTTLSYWLAHGFQWGTEVEINVGPLGFLSYPNLYTGYFEHLKLFSQFAFASLFAVLLLSHLRTVANPVAKWLYAFFAVFFASKNIDVLLHVLVFLIAYELILRDGRLVRFFCIAVLAALALTKGFFLFLNIGIVLAAAFSWSSRGFFKKAILDVGLFLSSFLFLWVICGQSIFNIPEFFLYTMNASDSYADVVAKDESLVVFIKGLIVLLLAALLVAHQIVYLKPRYPARTVAILVAVEAVMLFAAYKHGFVLPAGHLDIYFKFFIIISFILMWDGDDKQIVGKGKSPIWFNPFLVAFILYPICQYLFSWLGLNDISIILRNTKDRVTLTACLYPAIIFALLCCLPLIIRERNCAPSLSKWRRFFIISQCLLIGISISELPVKRFDLSVLTRQGLLSIVFGEGWERHFSKLENKMEEVRKAVELPAIHEKVGKARIASYMPFPGPLIFGDYNYSTTPSAISQVSLDARLINKDAAYFRDNRTAPSYILYGIHGGANRLPSQDGSLAQMEIFHKYRPVLWEAGYYLMERSDKELAPLEWKPVAGGGRYKMANEIAVPDIPEPLWVKMDIKENLVYKLVRFLYKPPFYKITQKTAKGRVLVNKYTPRAGKIGFLMNPIILNNDDMVSVYSKGEYEKYKAGDPTKIDRVVSYKIECDTRQFACSDYLDVRFEKIVNLGFGTVEKGDIKKEPSILSYIEDISLGDIIGKVSERAGNRVKNEISYVLLYPWKLSVHPGLTTPTSFTYNCMGPCTQVVVSAKIDDHLPAKISNDAGSVNLTIKNKNNQILSKYLIDRKQSQPYISWHLPNDTHLYFSVDNNGDPNTDWLLLTIENKQ